MDTRTTHLIPEAKDLMSRSEGGITTTLWYHGANATPKLTVEVVDTTGDGGFFVLIPEDHNCLDMYNHPYAYENEATKAA